MRLAVPIALATAAVAALIWRARQAPAPMVADAELETSSWESPQAPSWEWPSFDFLQSTAADWRTTAPEPDQLPSRIEAIVNTTTDTARQLADQVTSSQTADQAEANVRAFLDMIAYAEGTAGANGYRTLFGGGLFSSYADHPRQRFPFTNKAGEKLTTTAAGRYQFLARTWDALRAQLDLPDFGPASQDSAAIELIRQRGALADVRAGRFSQAVAKVAPIWASLPGAGYNQPERKLTQLQAAYTGAGGTLEA
jgi:lysozyme